MLEANGNLWDFNGIHCVTTNGFTKKDGRAVMGKGCALQAALKYPRLPILLGGILKQTGNHVYHFPDFNVITFPVKHAWYDLADPRLIVQSAHELMKWIGISDTMENIYLPQPGVGNGRLLWVDVKPLIESVLSDQVTAVDF